MIGFTLGRYFFFRYAVITSWFFLGIFALIFLIDFTEFSSRTSGLPGFTFRQALARVGTPRADDLRRRCPSSRCSRRWRR